MKFIIDFYYHGKLDRSETFQSREAAMQRFTNILVGFKGLVGWSATYPRELK